MKKTVKKAVLLWTLIENNQYWGNLRASERMWCFTAEYVCEEWDFPMKLITQFSVFQ